MTFSLTTKASGIYGGGSFGYGFADASGGQNAGPFYIAHVVLNAAETIIDPATAEGQASALTQLQAIAGAATAGPTATSQAAGNTLLGQIVSLLQQTAAETLWTDSTSAYFIRVDSPAGGAPTWKDVNGNASAGPGAGAKPSEDRTAPVTDKTAYQAIAAAGTTIAAGDFIDHFVTTDSVTGAIIGQFWLNSTQGAILATAPATSNLNALSLLPQGAATLAQQQAIAALLQQVVTVLGTTLVVKDAAAEAALGTPADAAATIASTGGSAIAWLRGIFGLLGGTLKTASQVNAPRVSASGPLAATSNAVTLAVDGMNAAVVQLSGTWAGTVAWSASVDGGATYFPINMVPFGGGAATGSATANGQWEFACGGITHLQAQMTAWTSGSATALIAAANGLKSLRVGNPSGNPLTVASLDGGLATIGTTTDAATVSGANTTLIGAARAIRDKLLGSVAVTGTFWPATQPMSAVDGGLATIGSTIDAATASGAATTLIGAIRAIRDKLLGSVAVTGTFFQATQPVSGTFFQATQPASIADGSSIALGSKADAAATSSSTSGSAISWLRGLYVAMLAPTPPGTANIGTVGPAPRAPASGSTTTVAATSTQLWPANASRSAWNIAAPQSADVWFNPLGGACGIGLIDCFRIPAGGTAKSTAGAIETTAFTYYCATGGLELAAYQL